MSQPGMHKSSATSLPSLSVRIDLDAEGRIGPGKIQLLEKIHVCGSISAAGRAMDMSYKRAWDLVDEINRICGRAAVDRQTGGKNGGGAIAGAVAGGTVGAIAGAQAASRPGYYLAQGNCYYRYPSGQYVQVDPRTCY